MKKITFLKLCLLTLFFCAFQYSNGQIELVKDINEQGNTTDPYNLISIGDKIIYTCETIYGREPWVSDGTEMGTHILKDIYTGGQSSYSQLFGVIDGLAYFQAYTGSIGQELFISDGTEAGTYSIDINPGTGSSAPKNYVKYKGEIYFLARDDSGGFGLWKTDGTQAGTSFIIDSDTLSSNGITRLFSTDNHLFMSAKDAEHGEELWVSDGTTAGTYMLKDIRAGSGDSELYYFKEYNGEVYFQARHNSSGRELWKSDGTIAGTQIVKDLSSGGNSGITYDPFFVQNGLLYFTGIQSSGGYGYELYKTDGTSAGTELVFDVNPGTTSSYPHIIDTLNGELLFHARSSEGQYELFITDHDNDTAFMLKDINPDGDAFPSTVTNVGRIDNKVIFKALGPNGFELFITDGTTNGTYELKDIYPGTESSNPGYFANMNDKVVFVANSPSNGREIWVTDDTEAGTQMVHDPITGNQGSLEAYPYIFANDNHLLFNADDGINGEELFYSDGTTDGTVLLKNITGNMGNSSPRGFKKWNGKVYFLATSPTYGNELFVTNSTDTGTHVLKDIYSGGNSSSPAIVPNMESDQYLFFTASDGTNGKELWRTDGTEQGTMLVKDIYEGSTGTTISFLGKLDNNLVFVGKDAEHGNELWVTDGSEGGTYLLKDINPGSTSSLISLVYSGEEYVYFNANDGINGIELWKTNGTIEGTVLVKDINTGTGNSDVGYAEMLNDILYFRAVDGENGYELWRTDGTESGTFMVKDINPGSLSSTPDKPIVINGKMYFPATNETLGREIWTSDGTAEGTQLLTEIVDGSHTSNFYSFKLVLDRIFFVYNHPDYGYELWVTDGTAENTNIVKDFTPGTGGITYNIINTIDNTVIYYGYDGGFQLWVSDGTPEGTQKLTGLADYYDYVTVLNNEIFTRGFTVESGYELYKYTFPIKDQTIFFDDIPSFKIGDNAYSLNAYTSSGLPVFYSVADTSIAEVLGDSLIIKKVGSTTITASQPGGNIHNPAADVVKAISVAKSTITFIVNDQQKIYGDTVSQLTFTIDGLDMDDTVLLDSLPTLVTSVTQTSDVGNYPIEISGGGDDMYDYIFQNGTFEVTKAALSFNLEDTIKHYGQENPEFDVQIEGFVLDQDTSVIDTLPQLICEANIESPVGEYLFYLTEGFDNNYNIIVDTANLIIEKTPLIFEIADTSKIYGESNPVFETDISGYVLEQDESVINDFPDFVCEATDTSDVGIYQMYFANGNDDNYELIIDTAIFIINKATLQFQVNDTSKIYGQENPVFITNIAGFVLNQDVSVIDNLPEFVCVATDISDAGVYEMYFAEGSDNNYQFIIDTAIFTIHKAQLSVLINSFERAYGETNPEFTYAIEGFVLEQDSTVIDTLPIVTCSADENSDVGTYDIVAQGGGDNNYELSYQNGLLTIFKATALVFIDSLEQEADGTPKPVVVTTEPDGLNVQVLYDDSPNAPSDTGTYVVVATIDEVNYEGENIDTLVIIPGVGIALTAIGEVCIYPNPAKDVLKIDLQNNHNITQIELLNMQGVVLKQIKVKQQFYELNISELQPGVYQLIFRHEGLSHKTLIKL